MPNNLWMMGGSHHHKALTQYIEMKKREIEDKQKMLMKPQKAQSKKEENALKAEITELERRVGESMKWAVHLYDRGVCKVIC